MKNFPKYLEQKGSILIPSMLLLTFKKEQKMVELEKLLADFDLQVFKEDKKESVHWIQVNHTSDRFWVRTANGEEISQDRYDGLLKTLKKRLDWIGPVYSSREFRDLTNAFCPLPNVLLVNKKEAETDRFKKISKELGLKTNELKSKYLSNLQYLELENPFNRNSLQVAAEFKGLFINESMPLYKPLAATIPNDPLWANQWNMNQINAPNGWDINTGSNTVVICVLDEGCDLTHPDLQYSEPGINLGTMMPDGSPTGNHGTACAGIAAASFNNNAGVAGLAGGCLIMPVAFQAWSDVEVANGINYATTNGADVISMSFGWNPWDPAIIDPEIQNAFNNNVVQCVATHNHDSSITYPATNPMVMACGASSTDDNRKSPASPDNECWGSNFGDINYGGVRTGVSVIAPGVQIPTTDIQGAGGYYNGAGPINNWACVDYPNPGTADGDYMFMFDGTSAATPHLAGLAALIRSQYPALSNVEIRNIIERTAAKVGTLTFTEDADFPNGIRNQESGYGRIDVFRALDFADSMIKDWSGDDGTEPSTPPGGNFWSFSDIVVRISDDNVFNPSDPAQSKHVERGQTNYIYVRVTNNGPNAARNVSVNIRITPYVGLQFVYPNDWNLVDALHVNPTSIINNFANIPPGGTEIAKFSVTAAQVENLWGWENANPWHPCLLAEVISDNDYAYQSADLSFGNIVLRKNNFAQRNLSVIDVLAGGASAFPFVVGSLFKSQKDIKLVIDRSRLPETVKARLKMNQNDSLFPQVKFDKFGKDKEDRKIEILERSCINATVGGCDAKLDLEKGSIIYLHCDKLEGSTLRLIENEGGKLYKREGLNYLDLGNKKTVAHFELEPNTIHPLSVELEFPKEANYKDDLFLSVYQIDDKNRILGGASVLYRIGK